MTADTATVMVLILDAAGGSVCGRTTLQKWTYFISLKTKTEINFIPHFYGPYSEPISSTINDLIASDFVFERGRITSHDRVIYNYILTEDGKKIARDLEASNPQLYKIIKEVVDTCTAVAGNNISVLSWAAKVYFLLNQEGRRITYGEVQKLSQNLGWVLNPSEIDAGVKLLTALKLANTTD